MSNNFNIKTPHAAVIVWNYEDRIGTEDMDPSNQKSSGVSPGKIDKVEQTIISTLSCVSIQTSKSKSDPAGTFQLTLAPYKNWVSTLTAGSWCCILMSNEEITSEDLRHANKKQVKMIGKIESVRVDTQMQDDGTRRTLYNVSGVDWGHIFNNVIYVDNLIASRSDPNSQGNAIAVALRNILFGAGGSPKSFLIDDNLSSIIQIFGQSIDGVAEASNDINRLATAIYNFRMPPEMVEFFDFRDNLNQPIKDTMINKNLTLTTGQLIGEDNYSPSKEARGFINPFSLQGQHTFLQVLLDNSNPALNEMYPELRWNSDSTSGLQLTLYNRIKPFSFKGYNPENGFSDSIKSYFQLIKTNSLDPIDIISVNAGTNWRDKYNFIEIKPDFQDFNIFANWYKQKAQTYDEVAFEREGFRPMIVSTKQFPSSKKGANEWNTAVDWSELPKWTELMREWFFNTHRMLNGTVTLHGITDYIAAGDNIKFDAGLLNPTPNINKETAQSGTNKFILGHVENISHSFTVSGDGARSYTTIIQFVRGIVVDGENMLVGTGTLDKNVSDLATAQDYNSKNVFAHGNKSDKHIRKKEDIK